MSAALPGDIDVRDAVITIQGGGIYGLSVLGQAQHILEDQKFTPLAFAGTSAGAIVATLLWARLSPSQIEQKFVEYAERNSLVNLLGPFQDPKKKKEKKFDFKDFTDLKQKIEEVFKKPPPAGKFALGKKFVRSVKKSPPGKLLQFLALMSELEKHFANRGIFRGDALEKFVDDCLREAPDVKGRETLFPEQSLTFNDFRKLVEAKKQDSFRPPLFIAVTNLTTQKLELINSVDDDYLNFPIGKVVRASAGVPLFFRPCEMGFKTEHGCYVDGGVVSNFPAWIFARLFRKKIQESKYFRWFSSKAWVHIGLRVGGDPRSLSDLRDAKKFSTTLIGMFTGGARNELEDLLSDMVPRSITIQQPHSKTDAPGNFLDVAKLDARRIRAMVRSGREFAKTCFKHRPTSILRLSKKEEVEKQLKKLVTRCEKILDPSNEFSTLLRANVFIAVENKLRLQFHYNFPESDTDRIFVLDFGAGQTGHCYISRQPMVCNLERIRKLALRGELGPNDLFGMWKEQHEKVRDDRTWLASVPVFDPHDVSVEQDKVEILPSSKAPHSYSIFSNIDGGVIGILNLDAALDYKALKVDEDPGVYAYEPRIEAILDTMQATAVRIGVLLAERFQG